MRFENRVVIDAPRAQVWAALMDIRQVAGCVPGADSVEETGPDQFVGHLNVRLGPIGLKFRGELNVIERNAEEWFAVMTAVGVDRAGRVHSTVRMELAELGPSTSELNVITDATVMGRIGEFGQPLMRKKADAIVREFAANLSALLHAPQAT